MKNDTKLEILEQEMFVTISTLEKVIDYFKNVKGTSITSFFLETTLDTLKKLIEKSKERENK